jgi:hypothetical protein
MRDFGVERIGFMARDRRALCPLPLRSIRAQGNISSARSQLTFCPIIALVSSIVALLCLVKDDRGNGFAG